MIKKQQLLQIHNTRIGSVTKTFTATLIFQLIEQGKLSLDTKLSKFFPEMPNATIITIGNLLNHTSGLTDYVNDSKDLAWITKPHAKAELLDTMPRERSISCRVLNNAIVIPAFCYWPIFWKR